MAELRNLLAFMDPEDRDRALRRYERAFDLAGEAGEEELIRSFGSPVRLVLELEREYRAAQKEGRTPFLDEGSTEGIEQAAPIAEVSDDLGETIRHAADILAQSSAQTGAVLQDDGEEVIQAISDAFPIEELSFPEPDQTEETVLETGDGGPGGEDILPSLEEEDISGTLFPERETADGEPPAAEPVQDGGTTADPDEETFASVGADRMEPALAPVPEPGTSPAEDETEEVSGREDDRPGFGRVLAAVLVTVPFIPLWIIGFALSLALGAVVMAVGFAFCVAGIYFAGYVVGGAVTFMPDMLLVAGGALGCFAFALLLIWMGLWFAVGGCIAVVRMTSGAYRSILKKKVAEEDQDDE